MQPAAQLLDSFSLLDALPQWDADVYKHQRGHSMIIGGDHGYGGAAALAAEASLKDRVRSHFRSYTATACRSDISAISWPWSMV